MAPDSAMQFLQAWYASQCDGDWEHGEGVRIATLDNPGWELMVDLIGTALEGKNLEYRVTERSGDDWLAIKRMDRSSMQLPVHRTSLMHWMPSRLS